MVGLPPPPGASCPGGKINWDTGSVLVTALIRRDGDLNGGHTAQLVPSSQLSGITANSALSVNSTNRNMASECFNQKSRFFKNEDLKYLSQNLDKSWSMFAFYFSLLEMIS